MVDDSIANYDALKINFGSFSNVVVSVNQNSQIGDIFPSIRLSSNEEKPILILWEFFEEIKKRIKTIVGSGSVIMCVVCISVDGISNSSWGLQKKKIRYFVPRMLVLCKFVSDLVINSIFKLVRSNFLQKAYMMR